MLRRSDMLETIAKALQDAPCRNIRNIYYLLIGAGLIKEEEHECKD